MFNKTFFISIIVCTLLRYVILSDVPWKNVTKKECIYGVYKYDTIISVIVNSTTEQVLDFEEVDEKYHGYPSRVHVSTSENAGPDYPVFITATQQKGVSSWELPLEVKTSRLQYRSYSMARTLCPHDAGPNITTVNRPTLHITTSQSSNVNVDVKLRRVKDFYLEVDKEVYLNATPSTPKYYYFSFDNDPPRGLFGLPRFNYTIPKSVILIVESDDDLCAVVSIQNNSCPVFDNEQDISYQGYHLTMMNKGGITLTQSMFPVGFYVVLIVKESDEECTGQSEMPIRDGIMKRDGGERIKNFRFKVIATISYKEYLVAALVGLAVLGLLLVLTALMSFLTFKCSEEVVIIEEIPGPSTSQEGVSDATPILNQAQRTESLSSCDSDVGPVIPHIVLTSPPMVAEMSRARAAQHLRRSNRYFWSALTMAVVYALPVVQLLFTYQRMVFQTGDQDLCYYNFLCAHPLGSLSDFNHVFSNIGYVVLGLAFLVQVRIRQRAPRNKDLGIPPHHGLLYSMGLALAMEGVLSACYHLCPNKMNFQFDSSFMYVIAVLCMVKLYQSRHPDVNANAHSTFMLLAVVMAIGVYGIMYPSIYFWVLFTLLHLTTCFILTMKIYYYGQFKMEREIFHRAVTALKVREGGLLVVLKPGHGARALLLAIANVANWAIAAYGLYKHDKDMARHILAILMGNTVLYILAYFIGKIKHKERIPVRAWLCCALAHVCWGLGLYLFLDGHTRWAETPAQSRRRNAVCSSLQFYDSHDLWHLSSAAAMFLTLNMLLVIDDPLVNTSRDLIPVF